MANKRRHTKRKIRRNRKSRRSMKGGKHAKTHVETPDNSRVDTNLLNHGRDLIAEFLYTQEKMINTLNGYKLINLYESIDEKTAELKNKEKYLTTKSGKKNPKPTEEEILILKTDIQRLDGEIDDLKKNIKHPEIIHDIDTQLESKTYADVKETYLNHLENFNSERMHILTQIREIRRQVPDIGFDERRIIPSEEFGLP
jgi:uncharacterized protein (UPF0335 family)